jgi:carboxyl-terminal processing protease
VEVLDRFIDEGVLVSTRGRTESQNWSYSAHRPGTWKVPLVLLVDGMSASASEIVAGAVDDYDRGTIVGRTTYGKWSVQSIFPLRDATGLRLTTAKFYSPHGRTLGKVGVKPDVAVEVTAAPHGTNFRGSDLDAESDTDIRTGLEILRKQITRR